MSGERLQDHWSSGLKDFCQKCRYSYLYIICIFSFFLAAQRVQLSIERESLSIGDQAILTQSEVPTGDPLPTLPRPGRETILSNSNEVTKDCLITYYELL